MPIQDIAVPSARSHTLIEGGVEQIIIPARRNWFTLLFLGVWLALWTLGGIAVIYAQLAQFEMFLLVWLCGWALGWAYAASTIAWQLTGCEIIRVEGHRLIHSCRAPLWNRDLGYEVAEIQGLAADRGLSMFENFNTQTPLLTFGRVGTIKFHYGSKTIRMGASIDEAEARQIVDWLAKRLPLSASS
jgi:hypothetical protein